MGYFKGVPVLGYELPSLGDIYDSTIGAAGDYVFGEGGIGEPIAVIIDPDETLYETFIETHVENVMDTGSDLYEGAKEPITKVVTYAAAFYLLTLALSR